MSLADGEYDIDLSQLLADPTVDSGDSSFAIRYGFIPDSMDQTRPLKLYQTDKECLLQAFSNDNSNNNNRPIIFEGAPQSHRKTNNPALNSYYLSFAHRDDKQPDGISTDTRKDSPTGSNSPSLQLRQLNSTIRVSKSRNAAKWEGKISQWDKQGQSQGPIQFPQIEPHHRKSTKLTPSSLKAQNNRVSPTKASTKQKAPLSLATSKKSMPPQVSSKRPPTATPEPRNDIISESDFEDLDLEEGSNSADFPMIIFDDDSDTRTNDTKSSSKHSSANQNNPATTKKLSKASANKIVESGKAKPKSKKIIQEPKTEPQTTEDIDIEDDFKDLEDQLQEVLKEEEQNSTKESSLEPEQHSSHSSSPTDSTDTKVNKSTEGMDNMAIDTTSGHERRNDQHLNDDNNDGDDDDDDDDESDGEQYKFSGGPIIINFDDESSTKPNPYKSTYGSTTERKPMSLRELYGNDNDGGDKDADMSSSEAE